MKAEPNAQLNPVSFVLAVCTLSGGQLLTSNATQAQCSTTVPAPPAPRTINNSGQSFGPPNPNFRYQNFGSPGCTGASTTNSNQSGGDGGPGQPGGSLTGSGTNVTITGYPAFIPGRFGGVIDTTGGAGGSGGNSGPNIFSSNVKAGNGAAGGAAGNLTYSFGGSIGPNPAGDVAFTGLVAGAEGGPGGNGGTTGQDGAFAKIAGDAGAGGAGGAVNLTVNGPVRALNQGVQADVRGGTGGQGGFAADREALLTDTYGGAGGAGGAGGGATLQYTGGTVRIGDSPLALPPTYVGLSSIADGGKGGTGGQGERTGGRANGGNGGVGGAGGTATATAAGSVTVTTTLPYTYPVPVIGISVSATGGDGGAGASESSNAAGSGKGGNAGQGGTASATVLGSVTTTVPDGAAFASTGALVQANGGLGGQGGNTSAIIGSTGGGGFGGAGGTVNLTLGTGAGAATIRTSGYRGIGALVQSVGGGGGNAGSLSSFFGFGGDGATGGNGGPVNVTANRASVISTGTASTALLAQSVGGGGGNGGDVLEAGAGATFAIGGNGGVGGDGSVVRLALGSGTIFASTGKAGGPAIIAQSIGGAGGNGGSVTSRGGALISLVIGGDGAGGGIGGGVVVNTGGLVTTYGDRAAGLVAQSIGGGGGTGGSAITFNTSLLPTAAVAIGGRGGSGGAAGAVSVTNSGQITTYGSDSFGVFAQSVGGGGGIGGAAAARAVTLSPFPDVPAISISVATGGRGGDGNTGGAVSVANTGLVTTAGNGSVGVMAQSVGGGGGNGGDSSASSFAVGPQSQVSINVSITVGGSGGSGGTGGKVTMTNGGLITTLGQDAYGVFAQSVGGGGGNGGAGDATGTADLAKQGFSASLAIGGAGGIGGHGGQVDLQNSGSILTRGDGSAAVFAQSVGGGGGAAGGGTATASGGPLALAVGVGGRGGAGGDGNTVSVRNGGNIVTRGTDAVGILAQSVGGGGGTGGKAGATAGGTSPFSTTQALFDTLAAGLNYGQKVTDLGDGILQIGTTGEEVKATIDEIRGILPQPQSAEPKVGETPQFNVAVAVGGSGGAAGVGKAVSVTNTGAIETYGAQSDGIYAQSVGGGGGSGGAATSTGSSGDDTPNQSAIGVGGNGGGGGDGGAVTVTNTGGGRVSTQGVLAFGVYGQSIGGGGGEAALAGVVSGSFRSLSIGLGGNGGKGGDGGAVNVNLGDGTSAASISTTGKEAVGILAQSIGGGGGLVRTMTTDQTFDPSKIIVNPQGRVGDLQGFSLKLGGQAGAGGRGGDVQVAVNAPFPAYSTITTQGLGAHAVVAQSVGGGGGAVFGGQYTLPAGATGDGTASGNGGKVSVQIGGATIQTAGAGAHGIIAQSVGGGGGLAGDLSTVSAYENNASRVIRGGRGDGGAVSVTLTDAGIFTQGANAHGIFAQSVGGGGGLVNVNSAAGVATNSIARGTAGGQGAGGGVSISLSNTQIIAGGFGSSAIVAQSEGTSSGPIRITLDAGTRLGGGAPDTSSPALQREGAVIRLLGGTNNQVVNAGLITAFSGMGGATGYAILADTPQSNTTVTNTGVINGNILLGANRGNVLVNQPGAVLNAPATVDLGGGTLQNAGTLQVGGIGAIGRTTINGDVVQTGIGTIVVNVGSGTADRLQVNGRATLSGAIVPVIADRTGLRPGIQQVSILTASGGLVQNGLGVVSPTPVVQYRLSTPDSSNLGLSYTVDYAGTEALQGQGLSSSNRGEVGRALNAILLVNPTEFAILADQLAALTSPQTLAATLDALSGEAVADVQQTVFSAQRAFSSTVLQHTVTEDRAAPAAYAVASLDRTVGPPTNANGTRVWVAGFGGSNILSGTDGQGSLHSQVAGALMGIDKWFDPDRMAGIAVGGGSTSFSVADRASTGQTTALNLGVHGLARFGQAYVAGVVSYGNYDSDVRRTNLGGATALRVAGQASVTSNVLASHAEIGWRQPVGPVTLTPFAALEVSHLWQDQLVESTIGGRTSAFALRYKGTERTSVPLTLGGRVGSTIQVAAGRALSLSAEVGWVHEFNPQRTLTATFLGAPDVPFQVLGVSASRNAAQTAANAKLAVTRNVAVIGNLTGRFSGVETAVGGYGGVQVTW